MNLTLFDLDGTLIEKDSDHAFGEWLVALGWARADVFAARNDEFYRQYQRGELDVHAYVDFATAPWRDRPASEFQEAMARFMATVMRPQLRSSAIELVAAHRRAGDLVAIVTSTNEAVTRPLADAFGVGHLLATRLERDVLGRVTGRIHGVPTFQHGKVLRVQQWLASLDHAAGDFEHIWCYSDSPNDLPLMEWSSRPVATNPNAALAEAARQRGWPILRLFT
ncbi:MAG: HAD family hydrolase [Aquabacterium sp.]